MTQEKKRIRKLSKVDRNTFLLVEEYPEDKLKSEKQYTRDELKNIHADLVSSIASHRNAKAKFDKDLKSIDADTADENEIKKFLELLEKAQKLKQKQDLIKQKEYAETTLADLETQRQEIEKSIPELKR